MAGRTKVAQFLKKRRSSQEKAAEALGISTTAFSQKVNGKSPFKLWELRKLAELYYMDANEIKEVFFD